MRRHDSISRLAAAKPADWGDASHLERRGGDERLDAILATPREPDAASRRFRGWTRGRVMTIGAAGLVLVGAVGAVAATRASPAIPTDMMVLHCPEFADVRSDMTQVIDSELPILYPAAGWEEAAIEACRARRAYTGFAPVDSLVVCIIEPQLAVIPGDSPEDCYDAGLVPVAE